MNLQHIRDDYPILQQTVHGRPLVYLDNAATLQMAEPVLRQIVTHYHSQNANVHRGVHTLSRRSTDAMESARKTVRRFLRASDAQSIIFTAGTTDGINILARLLPEVILSARDEVIVSAMEHHSNLIPWQEACRRCGATLRILPLTERGDPDMDAFGAMLSERCKIVAITWVSNVLGTVNPIAEITALSHAAGACVVVDAAQAVRQSDVDVQTLDCDFLAFSGHKLGALTGIGVLFARTGFRACPVPHSAEGRFKARTIIRLSMKQLLSDWKPERPIMSGHSVLRMRWTIFPPWDLLKSSSGRKSFWPIRRGFCVSLRRWRSWAHRQNAAAASASA